MSNEYTINTGSSYNITKEIKKNEELNTHSILQLLNVADMAINRTYLTEAINYNLQPLDRCDDGRLPVDFTSCTKLFRLKRFVYNPEENVMEKLKTFYLSLSHLPLNPSVFLVIRNTLPTRLNPSGEFSLYFGIRTEKTSSSSKIQGMLKESFLGTFLGSELTEVNNLEDIPFSDECDNVACVSAIPSVKKDTDDETAQIGMEQFIDVMRNKDYTAIILASPVTSVVIQQRKRDLENLYSKLSIYQKQTLAFGENQSFAVSQGINKSIGNSTTSSRNFTHTKSDSTTQSHGGGESDSYGSNSSSSISYGDGGGSSSSGSNSTHSTSSNWSNSQTFGFSKSEGLSTSEGQTSQQGESENTTLSRGSSKQFTIECINKNVVNMLQKIDDALKHIMDSEAYGLWECAAYFTTYDSSSSLFAANAYKAMVLGDSSSTSNSYITSWEVPKRPIPGQSREDFTRQKKQKQQYINELFTYVKHGLHPELTSDHGYYGNDELFKEFMPTQSVCGKDLPYFLAMPLKSVPGIVVDSIAAFERSVHIKKLETSYEKQNCDEDARIRLGTVFHMGLPEENTEVSLELNKFTSHCFISGSTGAGKSNTMARLLEKIIQNKKQEVNFLIIEPAKGEYKKDFKNVDGIHIFSTNPLCERLLHLNPFRFHPGIHVLEHIDRLLNIFGSCWELTAAMPAILKKAVELAYESIGWDLDNSFYIGTGEIKYPTFATVVSELRNVINSSDYSAEAKGNYTGALVTRVESLAGGILRRIFCSEEDISYEILFDSRTIIDLSRLGSPETKTLIMGVLVMLLSEYRMAIAQKNNETNHALRHITVIEEAHNLLKNSSSAAPGSSQLVAKSVEMFSNAIAEMRTYGEGFIIVDQSPTAVDISAIKNTNTKIVMRLPEQHDCEAMGNAMGMNEFQQKEIAKLLPGKAIVMQQDWTAAVMVAIDKAQSDYSGRPEIISQEGNRTVRATLAMAFSKLAKRIEYYLQNTGEHEITPEIMVNGYTIKEWWNKILGLLDEAIVAYESDPSCQKGIGRAKAAELRALCWYYCKTFQMLNLRKRDVKKYYGQLMIAILECENCWKIYLKKNNTILQQPNATISDAIGNSQKRLLLLGKADNSLMLPKKKMFLTFRNILERYIPHANSDEMATLCSYVIAFMTRDCGICSFGGTAMDLEGVSNLIKYENTLSQGDK